MKFEAALGPAQFELRRPGSMLRVRQFKLRARAILESRLADVHPPSLALWGPLDGWNCDSSSLA
eukprot:14383269-Alexandrium_andersonii.AAC.1